MSKTTGYVDLGKAPSDLIGKGFPAAATLKVNHEAQIPYGILFKNAFSTTTDGKVSLVVEPEYKTKFGDTPVAFKGKWTSADEIEGSVAFSDLLSSGTELKPWVKKAIVKDEVEITGGLGISFVNDKVNFNFKTESPSDLSQHKIDASLVIHAPQNLYWGVNAKYVHKEHKPDDPSPLQVQGRLHYQASDKASMTVTYEVDPKSKDKVKHPQLGLTWFQKISDEHTTATSFIIPPGSKAPSCIIASECKCEGGTSLKTKVTVSSENRLALAYTLPVSKYAVATLGMDLNANKLVGSSGGNDHSFGLELKLK
jgi:hypothetical protein